MRTLHSEIKEKAKIIDDGSANVISEIKKGNCIKVFGLDEYKREREKINKEFDLYQNCGSTLNKEQHLQEAKKIALNCALKEGREYKFGNQKDGDKFSVIQILKHELKLELEVKSGKIIDEMKSGQSGLISVLQDIDVLKNTLDGNNLTKYDKKLGELQHECDRAIEENNKLHQENIILKNQTEQLNEDLANAFEIMGGEDNYDNDYSLSISGQEACEAIDGF